MTRWAGTVLVRHLADAHGTTPHTLDLAGTYMDLASLHGELHRRHDYGVAVHKVEDLWVETSHTHRNAQPPTG